MGIEKNEGGGEGGRVYISIAAVMVVVVFVAGGGCA